MTDPARSRTAVAPIHQEPGCLFCRIARGEIPSRTLYSDDEVVAFHDINPARPVHFLVVPREHIVNLYDSSPDHAGLLGRILVKIPELARQCGLNDGFRVVINNGAGGGQEVFHLHIHVMGTPGGEATAGQ